MRIIIAFFILAFSAVSAQVPDNLLSGKRFIEITGTSETEITPDEIYITITLQERQEKGEKITITKQEDRLRAGIRELGIDAANLTLNSADADYRKFRSFKKDVVISKSYLLKISSAAMLGQVYELLDEVNAYDAFVSRVSHSKILDITKENRIKAMKAGKEKAEYLLSAIGQLVGPPIQVMESENYLENPLPYRGMAMKQVSNAMSAYDDQQQEISFRKIKLKSSFIMKYEIIVK
jgi:uncharacterized protein YggE